MMSGAAPTPATIRLSRSSCGNTHAGDVQGGLRAFFVVYRTYPLWEEDLRVYGHVYSAIPLRCGRGVRGVT
jgi:hypothetical protein